jgi:signal transduction histidine kinase
MQAPADSASSGTFTTIEEVARQTVSEIDQLVSALRDEGAEAEVEPPVQLAALQTLLHRHQEAGLDVNTTIHGQRRPLPPVVDRSAYRILQEALTNTARHGDGHAHVDLTFGDDALGITVVNEVDPNAAPREGAGGHGVVGMRERAMLAGGSLNTRVENGMFRLDVRLPFVQRPA